MEHIVQLLKPFVNILQMVDIDHFVMDKIYWCMHEAISSIKNAQFTSREKQQIKLIVDKRWK